MLFKNVFCVVFLSKFFKILTILKAIEQFGSTFATTHKVIDESIMYFVPIK